VTVQILPVPYVAAHDSVTVDELGFADDGIFHVTARYGFKDQVNVPDAVGLAQRRGLAAPVNLASASYFVSRLELRRGRQRHMARWRKALFLTMSRHAANPAEYFGLPINRTVVMGAQITI
jgi:KUP system potassium uptake protein